MGFRLRCDALDECRLAVGVGDAVVRVSGSQISLEACVLLSGLRVGNEVVAEEQPVPMLPKRAPASDHVDVVGARAALVAPDEERIPRRNIVSEARTPEVVVALRVQNGRNLGTGGSEGANLHEQVDDGLGGESGNSRAAEVLDAANESGGKAGAQMLGLPVEELGPAGIVRDNGYILAHGSLHTFLKSVHFRGDALSRLTPELSDAGGPARPHWQLTWPARVRSSDFVRRCNIELSD